MRKYGLLNYAEWSPFVPICELELDDRVLGGGRGTVELTSEGEDIYVPLGVKRVGGTLRKEASWKINYDLIFILERRCTSV